MTISCRRDDFARLSLSSSQETVLVAPNVVLEPGATVGEAINHTWFNIDTDSEEEYNGIIIKFKKMSFLRIYRSLQKAR